MTGDRLAFDVRSGGTITIDLGRCGVCQTQACLDVCRDQGGPLVLDERRDVPALRGSLEEAEQGDCVECLGCELACQLYGHQAVTIALPLEGFDDYLAALTQPLVYQQEW